MTDNSTIGFPAFLVLWNKIQGQTTPEIHLKLASWLERKWTDGQRRILVMAFRAFGKSTIVGIFCTWLLWRNPDLRILVLSADLTLSRKMVRQVKRIIEKHSLTKHLRPSSPDQWADERFTLKRNLELRDPSMLARGIMTNMTGSRADLIICDDVEVPKTCDSSAKRKALRERLSELDYILTPEGAMMYVGTPHDWNTIYADETRPGEERTFLQGYERIVLPIINEAGESAWPDKYSLEKIEALRLESGPSKFQSQMMCEPSNFSDGRFDTMNVEVYDEELVYNEGGGESILTIGGRRMVSGIAWWDPAYGGEKGDRSVVAIVFKDTEGHHWLHHIQSIRVNKYGSVSEMDQQCEQVGKILTKYYVPLLAVETNGIGMFLPGHLSRWLQEDKIPCGVMNINSRKPKNQRIFEAFEAPLSARTLHAHKHAVNNGFLREMQDWKPNVKNQSDDILDAVSGAILLQRTEVPKGGYVRRQNWMTNGKSRVVKTVLD